MGVINTTPDSFSDGGTLYRGAQLDLEKAMARAREMVAAGAAILDIGGESTRPGAQPVSPDEEMARVLPLVARIAAEVDVVISVDTSSPALMREAAAAGAGLLNDVRALTRAGALAAAASTGLPVCLMHIQGEPITMQIAPHYVDVVAEVAAYLQERVVACEQLGIARERLLLDPGFGFGWCRWGSRWWWDCRANRSLANCWGAMCSNACRPVWRLRYWRWSVARR